MEEEAPAQYRYFDRWYRIELTLFLLFGPVFVTLWTIVGWYYYQSGSLPVPFVKASVYFTVTFIFAYIFYENFSAMARSKTIVIDGGKVSKRSAGNISAVDLAEIRSVRLPDYPLANRCMVFESHEPKGTFVLPFYIRSGHRMVDRIFRVLAEKGLRFDGDADLRNKMYNAALRYNVLQKLRKAHIPRFFHAAAAAALLNAAAVLLYWEHGMLQALGWGFLNMLLQAAAYFAVERAHVNKLLAAGGKADEDRGFAGYYVMAGVSALLLGMIAGIIITEPM
ncbi:MAG: hypothetical protein FWB94_09680 [Chitinispirillia bacterium]|nr:hypothetical protein [Chitinispirillia bacterium]